MELQEKFDYQGGSDLIYFGETYPGTSPATARWRIRKYTWSGTNPAITSWANGTKEFDKIWDNRATYTYITS